MWILSQLRQMRRCVGTSLERYRQLLKRASIFISRFPRWEGRRDYRPCTVLGVPSAIYSCSLQLWFRCCGQTKEQCHWELGPLVPELVDLWTQLCLTSALSSVGWWRRDGEVGVGRLNVWVMWCQNVIAWNGSGTSSWGTRGAVKVSKGRRFTIE